MYVFDPKSKRAFFLAFDGNGSLFVVPYCTEQWNALEPIFLVHEKRRINPQPETTLSLMLGPHGELYAYETSPRYTSMCCAMMRICSVLSRKPWGIENFNSRFIEMHYKTTE